MPHQKVRGGSGRSLVQSAAQRLLKAEFQPRHGDRLRQHVLPDAQLANLGGGDGARLRDSDDWKCDSEGGDGGGAPGLFHTLESYARSSAPVSTAAPRAGQALPLAGHQPGFVTSSLKGAQSPQSLNVSCFACTRGRGLLVYSQIQRLRYLNSAHADVDLVVAIRHGGDNDVELVQPDVARS